MLGLRKRKSGFTLLELIIVVIVIGILASIALPRFIRVTERALPTSGHLPEVKVALVASSLAGDPGRTLTEEELEVLAGAIRVLEMDPGELPAGWEAPGPGPGCSDCVT